MSAFWIAFAYAIELSDRTFAATAALTGAARFALISDMAARSGNSSPASSLSSSRVSFRYSSAIRASLVALVDRGLLHRVRVGGRAVREDVRGHGGVDGDRDVRVDERHRGPLRQLFSGELPELFGCHLPVLLG